MNLYIVYVIMIYLYLSIANIIEAETIYFKMIIKFVTSDE